MIALAARSQAPELMDAEADLATLQACLRDLERILYFESYVVIDPGDTDLKEKELLSEERFRQLRTELGDVFVARMGAGAIKELLQRVDVDMLAEELRMIMKTETSQIKRQKAAKRLKVCDAFRQRLGCRFRG